MDAKADASLGTTRRANRGARMRALVQEGFGSADVLHVRELPIPEPAQGCVLVRMRAASVNALDWHLTHAGRLVAIAAKLARQPSAQVRGVDLAGVVEAVGPGVTRFKIGDEVFGGAPGAFAEYVSAPEDRLVHKPPGLSFEAAATIGVAGRTALQGLRDHARVRPGQRVLMHGAGGGVGTFAVQIAKALGAHVTAVTGPHTVELARSLGADEAVDYSQEDFARRPERYDAVFDVAATAPLSDLRRVLKPGGVIVVAGAAKRGGMPGVVRRMGEVVVRAALLRQRVKLFVAQRSLDDLVQLKDLAQSGRLRPAIERVFPLAEAREAVRYVGTGQARAKVVITP